MHAYTYMNYCIMQLIDEENVDSLALFRDLTGNKYIDG